MHRSHRFSFDGFNLGAGVSSNIFISNLIILLMQHILKKRASMAVETEASLGGTSPVKESLLKKYKLKLDEDGKTYREEGRSADAVLRTQLRNMAEEGARDRELEEMQHLFDEFVEQQKRKKEKSKKKELVSQEELEEKRRRNT